MSGSAFDSEFRISVCLIPSLRLKLGKCEGQKGHIYSSSSFSSPTGLVKLVIAQWSSVAASAVRWFTFFIFTWVLSMSVSFEDSMCCFTTKVDQLTLNWCKVRKMYCLSWSWNNSSFNERVKMTSVLNQCWSVLNSIDICLMSHSLIESLSGSLNH